MANDNFWIGMGLGYLFGKNKNNGDKQKEKGGCLFLIIIFFILSLCAVIKGFFDEFFKINPIATVIVSFILAVLVIIGIVKISKKRKAKRTLSETVNNAWELFNNGQYTSALELAEAVADKDNTAADLAGVCYRCGFGCDKDFVKAFHFFELAKDVNIEACGYYGAMLIQGEGCEKDTETGLKYLERAAVKERYAPACYEYALLLLDGTFIAQNEAEGRKYLRLASEGGMEAATELLNSMNN